MTTFFMFGKYSSGAIKGISVDRTEKTDNIIKKFNGELKSIYVLLGEYDLVLIVNLPGIQEAIKASVALSKFSGVSFTTTPAITMEQFDKMIPEFSNTW